jgi:hypothetical protein
MALVVNITIVVVIGVVGVVGAYAIGSYSVGLATQPQVTMAWNGAYSGVCTPTFWWIFQTGQTTAVTANFTLRNTGPSNGVATVTFTSDGSPVSHSDFFVGAGKTVQDTWQFSVGDCNHHQYSAYISGVKQD